VTSFINSPKMQVDSKGAIGYSASLLKSETGAK